MKQLNVLVRDIQADVKRIRLFDILGQQLGFEPDLDCLLSSLKAEALVSEEEYRELTLTFTLETVSSLTYRSYELILTDAFNIGRYAKRLPGHCLETAADALIEDFSRKILNKPVPDLKDDVAVNGGVEIFCIILNELRTGKWLDS
jgi:hypothetical protein